MVLWTLVRFLHVLGIAFFVGGQLVLAAAVVPAVRRHGDAEAMKAAARRFGAGSLVALGVLIATGAAMAGHYRRWGDGTLHLKLALLALVLVLTGLHAVTPWTRAISIAVLIGSLGIVWLGVTLAH